MAFGAAEDAGIIARKMGLRQNRLSTTLHDALSSGIPEGTKK